MTPSEPARSGLPVSNPTQSYWHREPSSVLFGHRTTSDLPETADVVIVGSGITGAFAAQFLMNGRAGGSISSEGKSVVMLEAREACWGATGRNGGHCQPVVFTGTPATAAFELANYRFLRSLVQSHSIPCNWTDVRGGVRTFLTPALFAAAAASAELFKREYPDLAGDLEIVYPDNKTRLAELHIPGAVGAVVQASAASLWPYKLVAYILESLLQQHGSGREKRGFNLQTKTPVTEVRPLDNAWEVHTPRGIVTTNQVLLATNAHTSFLLPEFADLIVPVRGQVAALLPPTSNPPTLGYSYGIDAEAGGGAPWRADYLIQRPTSSGELIFGGGRGVAKKMGVGEWRDDETEEGVSAFLKTRLLPPLDLGDMGDPGHPKRLEAVAEWTGIMGYSRDLAPFVGEVPSSMGGEHGLFLCAGFTGHGMPNAVLSAHAVVGMMMGTLGDRKGELAYELPQEFLLTEERIRKARALVTIQEWEALGWGVDYPELLLP